MKDRLLRIPEVSDYLRSEFGVQLSEAAIRQRIYRGSIPTQRFGATVFVRQSALLDALGQREEQPA